MFAALLLEHVELEALHYRERRVMMGTLVPILINAMEQEIVQVRVWQDLLVMMEMIAHQTIFVMALVFVNQVHQ